VSNIKKMKNSMVNSRLGGLVPKKATKPKTKATATRKRGDDVEQPPDDESFMMWQLKGAITVMEKSLKQAKQAALTLDRAAKAQFGPSKANKKVMVDTSALVLKQALIDIDAAAETAGKEADRLTEESPSNLDRAHQEGVTDGLLKALNIIKKLAGLPVDDGAN
jgi:hypothetical protein